MQSSRRDHIRKALASFATCVENSSIGPEKLVRKFRIRKTALVVFPLAAIVAGCGREQIPSPAFPTVVATFPTNGADRVITNTTVGADFSLAMNASTINTTTFTLTGPGGTPVPGAVSYAGTTAIF